MIRLMAVSVAIFAALALAACGSDDGGSTSRSTAPAAASSAFPVTITHALGTTTIASEPKRVVVVGYTDQEALLALGVKPVGAMDWFGAGTFAKWPWERAAWGSTTPAIVSSGSYELDFEKIAAQRPDLILGLYQDLKKGDYEKLSKIAPTVAQAKGTAYTTPWREMTRTAAKAVGRVARGEKLIAAVDAKFAAFRAAHPEYASQTAVMADAGAAPKSYYAFRSTDPRGQFLRELGFRASTAIDRATKTFGIELSKERLDLMDADTLFLLRDPEQQSKIDSDAVFQRVPAVEKGDVVGLDYSKGDQVGGAVAFNSVLSIPYAIDGVARELASATR